MSKRNIKLIVISIFSVILLGAGVIINSSVKTYTTEVMKIKKETKSINKEIKAKEKENNSVEVKKLQQENKEIQKQIDTIVNQNKKLLSTLESANKKAIDVKGSKWVGTYELVGYTGYHGELVGNVSIDFNEHDTNLKFEGTEGMFLNIIGPTSKVNGEFGYIKLEDSKTMKSSGGEYRNEDYEVYITVNNNKLTGIIINKNYRGDAYVAGSFETTKVK